MKKKQKFNKTPKTHFSEKDMKILAKNGVKINQKRFKNREEAIIFLQKKWDAIHQNKVINPAEA